MKSKIRSRRFLEVTVAILLLSFLALNLYTLEVLPFPQPLSLYSYRFVVDEDGFTSVRINYRSNLPNGSSWVFVPKFLDWTNYTLNGEITEWSLNETRELLGDDYYFYNVLNFFFKSENSHKVFEINIQFNFTEAAMIIEPDGIFYSPMIGFDNENSKAEVEVILPSSFNIKGEEVAASGNSNYQPSYTNSNYVHFEGLSEGLLRVSVGFKTADKTPSLMTIEDGIFIFEAPHRYANYAQEILSLFNKTYEDLVSVFNVTLQSAKIEFFLPEFSSIFSVGGYVPFTGTLGNIHINIFFTRYVEGYIEVIAIHELVHHFLWKAGLSPETFLWLHEGLAQYVSIEVVKRLEYEGATMMKQVLEDRVSQIIPHIRNNLGFLLHWTPSYQPQDWEVLYTAAYYVISRLAETYGGLDYYTHFFKLINGVAVSNNNVLGYYLSLAAGRSVVATLNSWGFNLVDLFAYSTFISEVEEAVSNVNPIYQPYRFLAEQLFKQALISAEKNNANDANRYLTLALLIAKLAPLLTLITFAGFLFTIILYALKKSNVFSDETL